MKANKKHTIAAIWLGASVTTICTTPTSAHAQSANEQADTEDDASSSGEIVVTATLRKERLQDVPISITAENGAALARRGATQLEDIVKTTPGLSNAGSGAGNRTNLTIRGVSTGTDLSLRQPTVALLFDDIPVDPSAAGLGTTNLKVVDIERVEVLRGPQGTLFGSGSLSGAIRFVTNKPDINHVEGSAELSGATTRGGDGSIWGNAVVNLPLITDKLAVRAVGYGFDEGGWIDNIRTGESDVNRSTAYGGRLTILAQPSDRLSGSFTAAYQDGRDHGLGESLFTPPVSIAHPTRVTDVRKSSDDSVKSTILNLGVTYDFGAVSLLSSSTYMKRKVSTLNDLGYFNDFFGLLFGIPGLSGPAPSRTANDQDIYTQEFRLSSNGSGALHWTLGGFYQRSDSNGGQTIISAVLVPVIGTNVLADLASVGRQEELAGFGQITYSFANHWDINAGARVSSNSVQFNTGSSGLAFTGSPDPALTIVTDINQKDTTVSPRFSLTYRPDTDLTLYVQAARGFRVGGPNLTAGLGGGGIPRSYDSDSLWNYELGAKTSAFGGRVQFRAAAYYIDWSNLQTALRLNNVNFTGNAGAARIIGLEAELVAHPNKWLEFGGSALLNSAKMTKDVPDLIRVTGQVGVRDGERLSASPPIQIGGHVQAHFTAFEHDAWLRASTQYVGTQYTDFGKLGSRFGDFATVDLRAGVAFGSIELAAFATNLFDSGKARSASDATFVGPIPAIPQLAFRLRPRSIGVTLRTAF